MNFYTYYYISSSRHNLLVKVSIILIGMLFMVSSCLSQFLHQELLDKGVSFAEIVDINEKHYATIGQRKGNGYKQYERWKYWAGRNLDSQGQVRERHDAARAYSNFKNKNATNLKKHKRAGSYLELGPQSAVITSSWSSGIGRISAIGLDESNDNHLIIGSPTGGVWKTMDLGLNWTPIFDDQILMDIYALEISHIDADIYWVGLNHGMSRSIDGGSSWGPVGGVVSGLINTIEMHPTDPEIVFAVDQYKGIIWRSVDGGQNFSNVLTSTADMFDLEFHPTDPDVIYTSGNGVVYKSTNRGSSFDLVTSGPWNGSDDQTIMMAVTAAAPSHLYLLEEIGSGLNAVYFSDDEGQTWSTITDNACNCNNMIGYSLTSSGGKAPRDMDIVVSPIDPDIIHIAGIETWRTLDLGNSWTQTTDWTKPGESNFIHADIDILIYDDNRILAGTDGGIYYSTDDADTWTDITEGLGIRQFYRIGASQTEIDKVSGGSQDNGTGVISSSIWYDWLGSDGMETFIDWSNADIIYGTSPRGNLHKSIDGGQSISTITDPGSPGNWVTPFEQDPIEPNIIYSAVDTLWKSFDGGDSWVDILTLGSPLKADEMKIAPSDNSYIYVSYGNILYRTSDGGSNWLSTSLPGTRLNYITVNHFDPQRVAVTISGSSSKVMESLDAGDSFTDITANIPTDISIECVVYEQVPNGGLFLGGNPGIYYSPDSTNPVWEDRTYNLPKVRVSELEIRNQSMYIATYGRGLWKFNFECNSSLEGTSCDDSDLCTVNDVFDANCNCFGIFADMDNDGVCDINDACPGSNDSIDADNDGIPDGCDDCLDVIDHSANEIVLIDQAAVTSINSNHIVPSNTNITFKAGDSIELTIGFEVEMGAVFYAYMEACIQ